MSIIWEAKLDETFQCAVVRTGSSSGQLTVKADNGKLLLDEVVALSYGAAFGPDIDDVQTWEDMCVAVVDKHIN